MLSLVALLRFAGGSSPSVGNSQPVTLNSYRTVSHVFNAYFTASSVDAVKKNLKK